jgi:phage shock protein A
MGILDRFSQTLKANLNSLIDKAEDPQKMIGQTIEEFEDELKKARREQVSALAEVKQIQRKAKDKLEDAAAWERKAMLALEHGDEELAREALKRKKQSESDALDLGEQEKQRQGYVEELKAQIEQFERKLVELKAKKNSLSSQVARARSATGNTDVGGSNAGAVGRLREMQDKIDAMEAEVEAADIVDDPKKAALEERFRRLERGDTKDALDDELSALKARLKDR